MTLQCPQRLSCDDSKVPENVTNEGETLRIRRTPRRSIVSVADGGYARRWADGVPQSTSCNEMLGLD